MPIIFAPLNKQLKIVKIITDEKTKKHLENLGLIIGANLSVISHSGGSVICMVKSGRLALDKNLATKLMVV